MSPQWFVTVSLEVYRMFMFHTSRAVHGQPKLLGFCFCFNSNIVWFKGEIELMTIDMGIKINVKS